MNEFVVPDVDPDMVDDPFALSGGIEEDEVTRFELFPAEFFSDLSLLDGGSRQTDTVFVADIAGEAGAVEGFGSIGTPDIFFAKMLLSLPE